MSECIDRNRDCDLEPMASINRVTASFVNTSSSISSLVDNIGYRFYQAPTLYIDLEGIKLSRVGTISIITLFDCLKNHIYIIDVLHLQTAAFSTVGTEGYSLKGILESKDITKVFFDVRNDSDALYHHFGIALQGIQDIQLMEYFSRSTTHLTQGYLAGLARCIARDAPFSSQEKANWEATKEAGSKLFDPVKGGSYQVFADRPLKEEIIRYCLQDVELLPDLHSVYWKRLDVRKKRIVEEESQKRVQESQSVSYQPHGPHKALGPLDPGLNSIDDPPLL